MPQQEVYKKDKSIPWFAKSFKDKNNEDVYSRGLRIHGSQKQCRCRPTFVALGLLGNSWQQRDSK